MKRSIDQVYRSYNRLRTMFVDNGTLIGKDPHYASSSSIDPIVKRYGVLHPYPLHSLWRSSPGQIRNFPVDATAS